MKVGGKIVRAVMKLAGGMFAAALMVGAGVRVQAKEVTVTTAKEFLEAVESAKDLEETLTVKVASGSDFTVERYVRLYSNTVINAEGATIYANPGSTLFVVESEAASAHITINGGTWRANGNTFIQLNHADDVTVKNATIIGNGDYLATIINSKNVTLQDCAMNGSSISFSGEGSGNAVKGGTISGTSQTSIQIKSNGAVVDGTVIVGSRDSGIEIRDAQDVVIRNTQIRDSHNIGIASYGGGGHTIEGNTLTNSGYRGINVEGDLKSVISGNTLDGSAIREGAKGEGLVVDYGSNGTQVVNNTVRNTKGYEENVGNGIIVNRSQNVTVSGNTVSNSNNHGIQVSFDSKNVTVSNNTISASGRMGISVSRGAQADLKENMISDSAAHGITFDGKEGRVSGSIENCSVSDSAGTGIWIEGGFATMTGNEIRNSAVYGMVIKGSGAKAQNNKIYKDSADGAMYGISVTESSTLEAEGNIISNFRQAGIYAAENSTVSGTNNQVNLSKGDFTLGAYYILEGEISANTLKADFNSRTELTAETLQAGNVSGVVIDGKRIETTTEENKKFRVTFADMDPSKIIVYTQDKNGNVICLQAPVNYSLKDSGAAPSVPDSANREEIEAFVKRLYLVALGRGEDKVTEGEVEYWTNFLASGVKSGAEVAQGFIFSQEMTNKNLSDKEFVDTLYSAMFDRLADEGGRNGWLQDLYNGASREYVYRGFAEGAEFANLCNRFHITRGTVTLSQPRDQNIRLTEFVSRVYYIALERTSLDEAGINDWCGRILGGQNPSDVVWGIVFSDECKNRGLNDEDFVTMLYKTYFNRDAAQDPAGFNDWVGQLKNGASREHVVNGFSGSKEFDNLVKSFGL